MAVEASAPPSAASHKPSSMAANKYNTSRLPLRLTSDLLSALSAGVLVAPIVCAIDKAIMENASGRHSLGASLLTSLRRPLPLLMSRPFALVLALYTSTYLSANMLDTGASTVRNQPASTTTSGMGKFAATSATNLSLSLYKDASFTKMFGTPSSVPRRVPGVTYALFAARDCLTVFASFNVPAILAPILPLSNEMEQYASRASVAQFVAPAAVQVVSTPIHLLGLDLYNRPDGSRRMAKVAANWVKSAFARMARIVPAFGVGGVVNTRVRKDLMRRLE